MFQLSPLARKRWRSFKRIRRAWWSLIALGAIFAFCMAAELVCPCNPREVVDTATLEKYRRPEIETTYDVKTIRFNVADGGEIYGYEGPANAAIKRVEIPMGDGPVTSKAEAIPEGCEGRIIVSCDAPIYPGDVLAIYRGGKS